MHTQLMGFSRLQFSVCWVPVSVRVRARWFAAAQVFKYKMMLLSMKWFRRLRKSGEISIQIASNYIRIRTHYL